LIVKQKDPVEKLSFPRLIKNAQMQGCKAPEVLRVASRRIRSNSWHARETVSGPEYAADGRFSTA